MALKEFSTSVIPDMKHPVFKIMHMRIAVRTTLGRSEAPSLCQVARQHQDRQATSQRAVHVQLLLQPDEESRDKLDAAADWSAEQLVDTRAAVYTVPHLGAVSTRHNTKYTDKTWMACRSIIGETCHPAPSGPERGLSF